MKTQHLRFVSTIVEMRLDLCVALLGLLAFLCSTSMVNAQTTFGSITGTVTDQSGADIPGATVRVTNEGTGVQRSVVTSVAGVYVVPNLEVGIYSVLIEQKGFVTYEKTGMHLDASQVIDVDARLAVATTGTKVEVVGTAGAVLNTQTASISNVTPASQLMELPVTTRQRGDEVLGGYALYNVGVTEEEGAGYSVIANGIHYMDEAPTVDGITVMSFIDSVGGSTVQTGIEATSEISVQLANAPAEFGRPVQLTMVSKSGSNKFHGSLFEDYNGNALNARNFFTATVPFRVFNDFGGSIGGPIKKDKTFFFGDYEGARQSTAVIQTLNVPLTAYRTGNFSSVTKVVTNPYTGVAFPNNTIPSSMISSVAQGIQNIYFLQPNYGPAGLLTGNYRGLLTPGISGLAIFDKFDTRLDHNFSVKDTVFARFSYQHAPLDGWTTNPIPPLGHRDSLRTSDASIISWTHTFTPTVLNEFRAGTARDNNEIKSNIIGGNILSQVGLQGVPVSTFPTFPSFAVTGFTSPGAVPYDGYITTNFEYTDNLSWVHGSHSMKFGFDAIRDRNGGFSDAGKVYGTYTFNGRFSGAPYADFLLGLPSATSLTVPTPNSHTFGTWWSAYAQDQFKVTRHLTLNYGLRWEAQEPYYDKRGLLFNFDPKTGALVVPDEGINYINPQFPSYIPIVKASQVNYPAGTLLNGHWAYFYPRLGFAYRPFSSDKTVISGAYGIYGLTTYGDAAAFLEGGPFSGGQSFTNQFTSGQPLLSFPKPFLAIAPSATSAGTTPSETVNGFNPNLKVGYLQQWNMKVEHQMGAYSLGGMYIGTHTVRMDYSRNLEQSPPSLTPYPYSDPASVLPYPNYIGVSWTDNGGVDNYNALQLWAKRPYGKNLFVNTGFTWAKDLTNDQDCACAGGSAPQNAYDLSAEYGNNALFPRKDFFAQVVYTLPFGQGQHFLGTTGKGIDLLVGGWRMAWMVDAHSGYYFTPSFDNYDPSNTDSFGGRPDVIAGVSPYPANKTINNWLNPGAFKVPGCPDSTPLCTNPVSLGRFGNAPVNSLEGPDFTDFDLSFMKDARLTERFTLEFRATATNVFNHPNFTTPAADISSTATYGVITSTAADLPNMVLRYVDFMLRLRF